MSTHEFHGKSDFDRSREHKRSLGFSLDPPGQSYPQDCPSVGSSAGDAPGDPLGEPLTIGQAGKLIGCSAWTVRQKYVPAGLPHLRSGPNGKLIFYKHQVIHWLLERQRKGAPRT
jgi:hypothetical protein